MSRETVPFCIWMVTLLTLSACLWDAPSQTEASAAPSSEDPPAPPGLVLLGAANVEGTDWLLINPTTGARQSLGLTAANSELLIVDDTRGEFYFRDNSYIVKDSWRSTAFVAQRVAPWPHVPGIVHAVWLDSESGSLRLLEMREPSAREMRTMSPEPPDARPYWAMLWGFEDGAWLEVTRRATSWGADGAVGPAVIGDLRQERGRSAQTIDHDASCAGSLCNDSPYGPPKGFTGEAPEDWRIVELTGGRLWLGVALGETWHPVGPLLLEVQDALPTELPASTSAGSALRLQLRGERLLVSLNTPLRQVYVIDLPASARRDLPEAVTLPAWVE